MSKAIEDVIAERKRQIDVEGWSSEHDDAHEKGELAGAAACYALAGVTYTAPDHYPPRKKYAAVVDARNSISEKEVETTREAVKLAIGEPAAPKNWPFHASFWKPTNRRRNLEKAAAFILAEIDRLDRASKPACPDCGRKMAKSADDAAAGMCPKWWAVRDADAERDCEAHQS
ncbi:hypothetical protein [Agrobacterium sp. M50-1]|uniref:hypothetical protein n=1 Tax=Agrobacterium sp. M50-1 TaxID=3132821 RepID=UPI003CE4A9ED